MNDFIFHNPAKVYFGKNQLEHLPEELAAFGTKVLMVYGCLLYTSVKWRFHGDARRGWERRRRETPIRLRTVYEMPASSSACLAHTRSMASRKARVCLLGMEDRQTRPW